MEVGFIWKRNRWQRSRAFRRVLHGEGSYLRVGYWTPSKFIPHFITKQTTENKGKNQIATTAVVPVPDYSVFLNH
jgi:hypothetical protein